MSSSIRQLAGACSFTIGGGGGGVACTAVSTRDTDDAGGDCNGTMSLVASARFNWLELFFLFVCLFGRVLRVLFNFFDFLFDDDVASMSLSRLDRSFMVNEEILPGAGVFSLLVNLPASNSWWSAVFSVSLQSIKSIVGLVLFKTDEALKRGDVRRVLIIYNPKPKFNIHIISIKQIDMMSQKVATPF